MKHTIIPIFIPHRGCPFTCVFCNQRHISGQVDVPAPEEVAKIIETYLQNIDKGKARQVEVAFFGGSFTAIKPETQESYLQAVQPYLKKGLVASLRVSTRPDAITPDILARLKSYGVTRIELGVQSLDEDVLRLSGRGYSADNIWNAVNLIHAGQLALGIQLMIGLPGDSRVKDLETARRVVGMKPETVRIYPTLVVKDTRLAEMYAAGYYRPLTLEEAVDITADMFIILDGAGIRVIRMGLHPTSELASGEALVAGPFHPGFGELVYSELFFRQAVLAVKAKCSCVSCEGIKVFVNRRDVSKMIGQRGRNRGRLREYLNIDRLRVVGVDDPERNWVGIGSVRADHPEFILQRREFYDLAQTDHR